MNIQPDFEELLRLLKENRVEYMVVGGYAVAFHGFARLTKDIDVFYRISPSNIDNLQQSLISFGFPQSDIPRTLFEVKGNILTFGVEPVRVDFISQIDGVEFEDAWPFRVNGTYGTVTTVFIGRTELIRNKLSTHRAKDKLDVEELAAQD